MKYLLFSGLVASSAWFGTPAFADTVPLPVQAPATAATETKKKTSGPPDPLPAFHAPLDLIGKNATDGSKAPNPDGVIAPLGNTRPLKVAIYQGKGAPAGSIKTIQNAVSMLPGSTVELVKAADFETIDLSQFDIVAFSGGMSSSQAAGLGVKGRDNVKNYVHNGGSYLGICAGAYLATSNYSWSLGILNAKTVSPKWMRGAAFLELELSDDGRNIFGDTRGKFYCRYHNGPILEPANRPELPPYDVEAYFRTEVAMYNSPVGIQVNSPAVITAPFGKGKILAISPHPENTKGLENFLPRGLAWLGQKQQ